MGECDKTDKCVGRGHVRKKSKLLEQVKDQGDERSGEDRITDLLTGTNVWRESS